MHASKFVIFHIYPAHGHVQKYGYDTFNTCFEFAFYTVFIDYVISATKLND
jgi:hypothetical protein